MKMRREKLLEDVWLKQHPYRTTYSSLKNQMSENWMEKAHAAISELKPDEALTNIEKYLYYNPGFALAYIMKSLAFQQKSDLRMASIAIKMAQEIGLSVEEQAGKYTRITHFKKAIFLKSI